MTEHPKCKTCKHWNRLGHDAWDIPPGFKCCALVEMSDRITDWNTDRSGIELLPEYEGHLASVMDGSSYKAELHCSPDFYCAMHSDIAPELFKEIEVKNGI